MKMGTIKINRILPMRNKFVYSCSVKICVSGFNKLLESIFCILLIVEVFSLQKSCSDAWISGSWLATAQLNMTNEAKLCSPICQTFWVWDVQCAVGYCHGEELGPCCWPMPAAGIAVFSASHQFLSILLRCNGFTEIQKAVVDHSNRKPPSSDLWPFFGTSLALTSALEFLGPNTELVTPDCHRKSTFYCTSQFDQEMVHCCCTE